MHTLSMNMHDKNIASGSVEDGLYNLTEYAANKLFYKW